MKTFVIFSLQKPVAYGGSTTYIAHLAQSLLLQGWMPIIVRVAARNAREPQPFTHGFTCLHLTLDAAVAMALEHKGRALIGYTAWKTDEAAIRALVAAGVPTVVHDPVELMQPFVELIKKHQVRCVCIRPWGEAHVRAQGIEHAQFIPHPYVPVGPLDLEEKHHAITMGRIDFRKHTEIVCEANRDHLNEFEKVQIYGAQNRMFTAHILDVRFPGWRDNHRAAGRKGATASGAFAPTADAAVRLAASACFAVDLTVIRDGDGDGSQYAFLEAWDGGAGLIIHRGWLVRGNGEMQDGVNCIAVGNAVELTDALRTGFAATEKLRAQGKRALETHAPAAVIPRYMDFLQIRQED